LTHPAATRNTACGWIRSLIIGALISPSIGPSCVGMMMTASPRIIQGASISFSIRCPIRVVQRVATLSVTSSTGRCPIRVVQRVATLSVTSSTGRCPIRVVQRVATLSVTSSTGRCPIRVFQRVATLGVSPLTVWCSIRVIHRTASFRVLGVCPSALGVCPSVLGVCPSVLGVRCPVGAVWRPIRVVKRPPILKILLYLIPLAAASIRIRHIMLSCVSALPSLTLERQFIVISIYHCTSQKIICVVSGRTVLLSRYLLT
jgi:hypothetical protein